MTDEQLKEGDSCLSAVTPIPGREAIYEAVTGIKANDKQALDVPAGLLDALAGDPGFIRVSTWMKDEILSSCWTLLYVAGDKALVGDGAGNTRTIHAETARAMYPVLRFPLRTERDRIVLMGSCMSDRFEIDLKEIPWSEAGCAVWAGFSSEMQVWAIKASRETCAARAGGLMDDTGE